MPSPFDLNGKIKPAIIKTCSDTIEQRVKQKRKAPLKPDASLDTLLLLGKDSENEQTTHDRYIMH